MNNSLLKNLKVWFLKIMTRAIRLFKHRFFIVIIFIALPLFGYYLGYNAHELDANVTQVQPVVNIPSPTPILQTTQIPTATSPKNFSDIKDFFVQSPLLSKTSGIFSSYGKYARPVGFSSDITELIKTYYPKIKLFQNVNPPAFFLRVWSYYGYSVPTWTDQEQYVSVNDGKTTLFADIGIRGDDNYTKLTYANLKKEFGNIMDSNNKYSSKSTVFTANGNAVIIGWKPTYLGRNGVDDHPSLLATIYLYIPNSNESNAVQLLVSLPSYLEFGGMMSDNLTSTSKDVVRYQEIIDSYFEVVTDIFNNIKNTSNLAQ